MAKTILGIDIGTDSMKLALCQGGRVKKAVSVPMPVNLVREGRIVSTETMGELLRGAMRDNGLHARYAAFVLPNDVTFVRSVTMPRMTADQLAYNIPFEFNDYITDELKNYVFDYAMLSTPEELAAPDARTMELMAVAAPAALLEETQELLRHAGLKLIKAAPAVSAYIALIRAREAGAAFPAGEYCILDMGYQAIRMHIFHGERHMVTRILEVGLSSLDEVIADRFNVDVHLAHTYLLSNYENCQTGEACMNAYGNIAVELMRALNFYSFSNVDSRLADVWLCGGGAAIEPLGAAIRETLDLNVHSAAELLADAGALPDPYGFVQAIGITMD